MNKTNPTHLNSVFEIDIWIDDSYSDDRIVEIVAYPMPIVKHHGNGREA